MDLVSLEGVRCADAGDMFACNLQTIRWCVVQLLATTSILLTLLEKLVGTEPPLQRVVALFALYTFFLTQPSETHPPLHSINHIEIAIGMCSPNLKFIMTVLTPISDTYTELLSLPTTLTDSLAPLAPYVVHTLSELLSKEVFHILPHSSLGPYNPRTLPREVFVPDGVNTLELGPQASTSKAGQKAGAKKGRPSKNEKLKKARDAVVGLEKWLDKTGHDVDGVEGQSPATTHVLISNAPSTSRTTYQTQKKELLDGILSDSDGWNEGEQALNRANMAVLGRLKEIDRRAAERGLEVGGEGGESTGLGRVEKAAEELGTSERRAKGGILGLLEGGGLADS